MPDMENVIMDNAIRGLQNVIEISGALVHLRKEYAKVILELLKEQEDTINELQNAYGYLQKQFFEAQDKLLKEQDLVEPKKEDDGKPEPWTVWWYVCGDCGQPIDKMDRFCRRCGKQVKWK